MKTSRLILTLPLLAALALGLAACGGGDGGEESPTPTEESEAATPTPTSEGPSAGDLAHSVVQILAVDTSGAEPQVLSFGSGSIISSDGLILTNAHVVDQEDIGYDTLAVAFTEQTDQPPELNYIAEIVTIDFNLDLAVIRLVEDLDGNPPPDDLPFISPGDSDNVEIGDALRVLGYPAIGGETITFTDGVVSGFTSQRGIEGRAWIKTDAAISGGNSGGLAVNAAGELVGVPTQVGTGDDLSEPVDCRFVADTNRDGFIDQADTCVPVGGFINGLRPVNLAQPLIEAAEAGESFVRGGGEPDGTTPDFVPDDVIFHSITFADGVTVDDLPTQEYDALPAGVTSACAFWDYEAMADGVSWEAVWFIDGEIDEQGSMLDQTWVGGAEGNWWVCILDDIGLPDGLYEIVFSVADEFIASNSVFVGGEHPPVEFTVVNESSSTICYLRLSPTLAQNWGPDELALDEFIEPGDVFVLEVSGGPYDVLIQDCDLNDLDSQFDIDLTSDLEYTLSDV